MAFKEFCPTDQTTIYNSFKWFYIDFGKQIFGLKFEEKILPWFDGGEEFFTHWFFGKKSKMPKTVDFFPQKLPINKYARLKMFCPDLVGGGGLLTVLHRFKKKVAINRKKNTVWNTHYYTNFPPMLTELHHFFCCFRCMFNGKRNIALFFIT